MGRLIPEDFPLSALGNDAERRVVEAFRDGLTDGWLILPDVGLSERRDFQLDLVLLHEDWGIVDVEVKGHRVQVRDGAWFQAGSRINPQPLEQARTNAYALRSRLRAQVAGLEHVDVEYAVALPNTTEITGQLPPDVQAPQVLTAPLLDDPQFALETLMKSRFRRPLTRAEVEAVVALLRPDAEFGWDPEARARAARERLDDLCANQVAALETLDANRRAYVAGRAGTGKTRLATGWARRALMLREERVLLTCYNDPLADGMRARLPDDPDLVIGPFLRVAFDLEGMPPLSVPADADHEWWNTQAVAHLHRYWHQITDRFDTVVVDEGQDFSPAWLAFLEQLLDPDGPRRLLVVADEAQNLYDRGFRPPSPEDGWAVAELVNNCRNVHQIATILRRYLDGAKAPMIGPESLGVTWHRADDLAQVTRAVNDELLHLLEVDERDPRSIVVATFSTVVRDTLRAEQQLVPWEARSETHVACENVHRIKGLEADCVLLASPTADVSDALLYVGISRAISQLVLIGPEALAGRVGLAG